MDTAGFLGDLAILLQLSIPSARVKLKVIQCSVQAVRRGRSGGVQPFHVCSSDKRHKNCKSFPSKYQEMSAVTVTPGQAEKNEPTIILNFDI